MDVIENKKPFACGFHCSHDFFCLVFMSQLNEYEIKATTTKNITELNDRK